ncbi:MAG: hypothetical protein KBT06_04245 [Prevotellaceae bacterium]|nr:hypothetical protein [Candidatus Colivivens equi]
MNELLYKYENYCHLNDGNSGSVYYNLLSKVIPFSEIKRLFPTKLNEKERERRKSYQYLYLWDCLFYNEGFVYNAEYLWKNENHKKALISKIRESIEEGLDDYLYSILFTICYHWPEIRDLIYSDDKYALNECETAGDYKNFIDKHPNTYKEFLLAAKYKYSILTKSVFSDVAEVLKLFPNSELIGVEDIKRRCVEINGLQVMYDDEVLQDKFLKEFLNSFIKSLAKVEDAGKGSCRYILDRYITKEDYMRIMYSKEYLNVSAVVGNKSESQISTFGEFTQLANRLMQLTGLKFAIPTIESLSISPKQPAILRKEYTENKKTFIFNVNEIGEWCFEVTRPIIFQSANKDYSSVANQTFGLCRFIVEL